MVKRFLTRANSLFVATAMTVAMAPVQMVSAAGLDDAAAFTMQQVSERAASALDLEAITGKEYTVIEGNAPALPKNVKMASESGATSTVGIQWDAWDKGTAPGKHTVTGAAGGKQIAVTVEVLPCDEVVPDVLAMGRSDGTEQERAGAVHPLRGYKGLFVTEYDIVPEDTKSTHDRAVIYLPAAMDDGSVIDAENCWDTGARLQFKYGNTTNGLTYFQTQNGDGQVVGNAKYYPTNEELDKAIESGGEVRALPFDEVSSYHVRTVMDTATDKVKANYKIYITDPDGIEHEVTMEGGNGFRIYPKDGVVKQFAAVRGSYRLTNHKVSWISGYATKNVERYLKAEGAAEYVKEAEDIVTKEVPGVLSGQQDREIVAGGKLYRLDTELSGWYDGTQKVASVTAEEGDTVTYRAYYAYVKGIDKTVLEGKIQNASSKAEADYTAASWSVFADALEAARQVSAAADATQEAVDEAAQSLDAAEEKLVSIKELREAVDQRKAELAEKEGQKADYANWDEVVRAVESAERILKRTNATKAQVENAVKSLEISLVTNAQVETAEAKEAMERAVGTAEQKMAQMKEADYTPASWAALKNALEACKKLDPETAAKADYVSKKDALGRAMEGLLKRADKGALNKTIASAKTKVKADYEAASYKKLQDCLAAANAVSGNPNATQAEVDKARGALQDAINKLVKKSVKVKSIKPVSKVYKIAAGKKLDLKKAFTVSPKNADNKKLTFSVSQKCGQYARIKSGVVTVNKKGAGKTIAIKATAADGSGKSATVKVKIMKNAVTKVTVKKKTLTVKAGKKVTLKPTVLVNGKKANKELSYTSSNEKLATVKNGVVKTKKGKTGSVVITIKSTDGTNKSVKVKIKIKK